MKRFLPPFLAVALLAGCTSPGFRPVTPYTTHARYVVDPEVVDGVTFYQFGGPKRPYEVIGYADEYWYGAYLSERELLRCAKTVREANGNAGIVVRGGPPERGEHRHSHQVGYGYVLRLQIIK
jgi:hypothetical protein